MKLSCPIDITPYAQSNVVKTPPIINLNYTCQDFWSLKSRLVDFLMQRFGPNGTEKPNSYNDLVESSLAIMLIENWAFIGDLLSFKMDQVANEIYTDTVTEIENAFRIAKQQGFQPQPPIAARSMWSATMNTPLETDVVLTAPVQVQLTSGNKPITIELFQADSNKIPQFHSDIIIPAGQTLNTSIVGLEGKTKYDVFIANGQVSQKIQLKGPVIYDSIEVLVDGLLWQQMPYFTDSNPRREYLVEFDSQYNAYLIFGNGSAGLVPSDGSKIQATYRVGGGVEGNIVTGAIEVQKMAEVTGLDYTVPVILRNYTKGEYGYAGDTIEDIRRKLPRYQKTQDRAVSGEDYKNLCDQFATPYNGQVGKSNAILRHHGCAGNVIDIYIVAKDGTDGLAKPSNELKVALYESLDTKKMLTDYICIRDGTVLYVDVNIEVILDRFYRKFEEELRQGIESRITSFFSLNNWDFGKTLKDTDIIKSLSDIKQITTYEISFTTDDPNNSGTVVTADYYEIIRPDTTTITFMYEQEN